jgi:myo-inositol-1(or 4)-monophosphatase
VIVTGIPHRGRPAHQQYLAELAGVMQDCAGIRRTGSAATDLAWVASGRFDGFWERNIQPWDMAAGIVLIREAGGFVSDAEGGQNMLKSGSVVGGNEAIQAALLKRIVAANR